MPSRNRGREAAKARLRQEMEAEGREPKSAKGSKSKKAKGRKGGKGRSGGVKPKPGSGDADGRSDPSAVARENTRRTGPMFDPSASEEADVRYVQPFEAAKTYVCPGCNRDIPPGTGHVVAVPPEAPDLRRHWHRGCWRHRHNRY